MCHSTKKVENNIRLSVQQKIEVIEDDGSEYARTIMAALRVVRMRSRHSELETQI